jgi:hypothetical protein
LVEAGDDFLGSGSESLVQINRSRFLRRCSRSAQLRAEQFLGLKDALALPSYQSFSTARITSDTKSSRSVLISTFSASPAHRLRREPEPSASTGLLPLLPSHDSAAHADRAAGGLGMRAVDVLQ